MAGNVTATADGNVTATNSLPEMGDALDALGRALDGVSYADLEGEHPIVAQALAEAVREGYTPAGVRRWALGYGLPEQWAGWLMRAARWLEGEGE